jgi:hypothetical protein
MKLPTDPEQCSWCTEEITEEQKYARLKLGGQYYFLHRNDNPKGDCYATYLLNNLKNNVIQAT